MSVLSVSPEHLVDHALTRGGLYPDRHGGHRYMGEPALYPCCGGRGWYHVEDGEKYCRGVDGSGCRAGDEKRRVD